MIRNANPVGIPEGAANCVRCGEDFRTFGGERVCPKCRKPRKPDPAVRYTRPLTPRQLQVIRLVQQAKLNKEIAYELHLTEGTIKEYLNGIYRQLGLRNRGELILWAFANLKG